MKRINIIVSTLLLLSTIFASDSCDGKKSGYYCKDETELVWCYGASTGTSMQCPNGLKCQCGYFQNYPCGWDHSPLSCDGKPGDYMGGNSNNPPANSQPATSQPATSQPQTSGSSSRVCPPCDCDEDENSSTVIPTPVPSSSTSSTPAPPVSSQPTESSSPTPPPPTPGVSGNKMIGYFSNWAQYRSGSANGHECKYFPRNIDPSKLTHINYAFAMFGSDFKLSTYEWNDETLYTEMMNHKQTNPNLKVLISIGGWNFNFYDATKHLFSSMAASSTSRKTFIDSCIDFAVKYGFDGIDIDWEYPGNPDQGGTPADKENFSLLLKEFREAIEAKSGTKLLLTMAAPAGLNNIQNLELNKIHNYLDWINVMTYDLHGSWDGKVGAHTALFDTDTLSCNDAMTAYIDGGVPASKLILGMAFYGKTFTLSSATSNKPGDTTTGDGVAGKCTRQSGFVSYDEILDLIKEGATTTYDEKTHTMYAQSGTFLVTYDNMETHNEKIKWAKEKGLGGYMFWALDLDVSNGLLNNIYTQV